MAVDPAGSANLTPPQPPSANGTGAGSVAPPAVAGHHHHGHGHKPAAPADQVVLSATSTAATGADSAIPSGTLPADQLKAITEKLATGAYDGTAVADRIAGKLIDSGDITGNGGA